MVEHRLESRNRIGPTAECDSALSAPDNRSKKESMNLNLSHLRLSSSRSICALASTILLAVACTPINAQMSGAAPAKPDAPMPSPPATATVTVAGGTIDIHYNTPHMRGRKIMGDLVPYDQVWRTGANPATTIITSVPLKFGTLLVPAGTHTLYSLPSTGTWQLIINNQTGQWGTVYDQTKDLGRTPMTAKPMSEPQEVMSLSFENTKATSTELHVRWETTDRYVTITKP
jgi:Protein of unknown function (DUF2911)